MQTRPPTSPLPTSGDALFGSSPSTPESEHGADESCVPAVPRGFGLGPMMQESFPAAADVERFGNLLLQAWAPPAHESLADDWIESAVRALLAGANDVYLLGHLPGVLSNVPHDAVSQEHLGRALVAWSAPALHEARRCSTRAHLILCCSNR